MSPRQRFLRFSWSRAATTTARSRITPWAGRAPTTNTLVTIAGGANAVGFDVWGYGTFIANAFDAFNYDRPMTPTASSSRRAPITADANLAEGYLGVVSDTDLIGSVLSPGAPSFGSLATNELAANIQVWVPAPSALAVFGLGGALAARRRR